MRNINGFNINLDISQFIKISDLIYFDGPLLSHYMSEKGENYLFYWVDVDDSANRWLIIRTDIFSIQKYIDRKISLYEIIKQPNDGFVYMVDIDENATCLQCKLIQVIDIPEDYIPTLDSFFDFELTDDIDLSAISQKYSSGILEIHISGNNVKYGSIPFNKFSSIIPKIEDIRKSMSERFIKRRKDQVDKKQDIDRELRLDTQYEYMYSLAGSVRVILKPLNPQKAFCATTADDFAQEFTGLFTSGYNKEDIEKYSDLYDKKTIKKYNDLIYYLNEEKLSLGLKWCNTISNININRNILMSDIPHILSNLSNFEYDNKEEIVVLGKFYSLNIKTGSYSIESVEGDDFKSTGFIEEKYRCRAYSISFNKVYKIIISRNVSEQVGGREKIKDFIIHIEDTDN